MRHGNLLLASLVAASIALAAPPQASGEDTIAAVRPYLDHPDFTWKCERSAHFQFCYEPRLENDPSLKAAKNGADAARSEVLGLIGAKSYEPLIYVFFLESRSRMKDLIGFDGEGRSRPTHHAIFFVPTPIQPNLAHELCHEIVSNVWGAAESWIEEGLATFAAFGGAVHHSTRAIQADGALLPLEKLVNKDWDPTQYSADVTYFELADFVMYLRTKYGMDHFRKVWQEGSEQLPKEMNKSLAGLEKDWLNNLAKPLKMRPEIIRPLQN